MRTRLGKRSIVVAVAIVAILAASSTLALTIKIHLFGSGGGHFADVDVTVDLPQLDPIVNALSAVQYEIHTDGGPGCATARVARGVFGVPTPVDVAGNLLPDIAVTVIPVPAGGTTVLTMNVTKIAAGALPARVQAVLAPGGTATPDRVAFGYDACGSASPGRFQTRIVSAPTRLSLDTKPTGAGPHLTILGAAYKQSGTTISDPTQVAAKFAPVPTDLNAIVDILPNSTYKAHVDTNVASELGFAYLDETTAAGERTDVTVGLVKLPQTVDLTLTGSSVDYTTSAPIDAASVDVTTTKTGERTTQVSADLGQLPTSASFVRDGASHATFTTPGVLGAANVRFANFEPGTILPATPTNTNQFFSAEIRDAFNVADLRLTGVKTLSGGWGDDFDLDLVHDAGPFDIGVVTDTQSVDGAILDLPADIELGYTKALGTFTYDGSDTIGMITFDLLSTEPLGDTRADEVHTVVSDIPKQMTATLDHTGKTFTADMEGDKLGEIEILVTNGPTDRIPEEVDGLVFTDPSVKPRAPKPGQPPIDPPIDPSTPYEAFVRVSELEEVTVGWGETQSVHVLHDEQPFKLDVELAERSGATDIDRIDVVGTLASLPHDVGFTYTPGKLFTYDSDTQMQTLDITVQRSRPTELISKLGVHAELLPMHLDITFDEPNRAVTATVEGPPLHLLEVSQRTTDGIQQLLGPDTAGVSKLEKIDLDGDEHNNSFVRLKELTGASVVMGPKEADAPITVSLHHAGGPFLIKAEQDGFGPKIPIFKNTRKLEVTIPNLPAAINTLSYAPTTKELHFNGGSGIDVLDVNLENNVEPLAGDIEGGIYAKKLKLHVEQIPAVVDLVPTFLKTSDDDQTIALELGAGQSIGVVDILLTSLPEDRLPAGTDGLLLETLNDRYVIHGHITGLSSFRYESSKVHIEEVDPKFDRRTLKYDRSNKHVHLLRTSRAPLRVDVRKFDEEKDDIAYITTNVADAPEEITLDLNRDKRTDVDEESNKDFRTFGTYNSSSAGGVFTFDTNEGKVNRTNLNATLDPMPKDANFCLSTAWAICSPARKDPADHRSELSVVLEVSQPVHLDVTDTLFWPGGPCGPNVTCPAGDRNVLTVGVDIEKRLVAHHQEHEVTGVNNHFIYLDTGRGYLEGQVRTFNFPFGSNDIIINFPAGPHPGEFFRTDARDVYFVIHTNGSYDAERISGLASCTAGVDIAKETGIIGIGVVDLDEGFCSAPETIAAQNPDGSPASLVRGAADQTVYLFGDAPQAYSPGAVVVVTRTVNGAQFPVDGVQTVDVFWEDFDRVRVLLSVDDDADPGTYNIFVRNQSGGGEHTCVGCVTIT
jgi:hypothetical protein